MSRCKVILTIKKYDSERAAEYGAFGHVVDNGTYTMDQREAALTRLRELREEDPKGWYKLLEGYNR